MPHFVLAGLKHGVERRALPVFCCFAFTGRAVFEGVAFVRVDVTPAKALALEYGMQRVDEDEPAREFQPGGSRALAEFAHKLGFGDAGQAGARQPIHDLEA